MNDINNNNSNNNNNPPIDDNDNDNIPQEFGISSAKDRNKYKEERLLAQMRNLVDSRWTVDQICQKLRMPRTTYYRWLKKLAKQDRKYMEKHYADVLFTQLSSTARDFGHVINVMRSLLDDKTLEPEERIEAAQLLCEVSLASTKLYMEGPMTVMHSLPGDVREEIERVKKIALPSLPNGLVDNEEEEDEEFEDLDDVQGEQQEEQ